MSKLLRRAKTYRVSADFDFDKIQEDDTFLDKCCFDLQQSIEFTLKYIIELSGANYVKSHDLRQQVRVLDKLKVKLPMEDELLAMSGTLNDWEASSRYKDNFVALIREIKAAMQIADALIEYASDLVVETDTKPMDSF